MITADHETRQQVLIYASAIAADPSDVISVVVGAGPLLDWLEAAVSEADFRLRCSAMERHHYNCFAAGTCQGISPEKFVAGACAMYVFVTGAIEVPDGFFTEPEAA
jgi:hypothetical protein